MNLKINKKLDEIKNRKRIGFMGHIIAGFPDYEKSIDAALGICDGGADFLEVQFPFSDPFADGPIIENACYRSIENGFSVEQGFKLINDISKQTDTCLLIMTYANIIFKYGIEKFIKKAVESNVTGLIIPDIPIDYNEDVLNLCKKNNIVNILLATPGGTAERIKEIAEYAEGFIYTVARRGITGRKSEIDNEAKSWFKLVNENSKLPIAVGFGIRSNEQIKQLYDYCDIAIIGSHFVTLIDEASNNHLDIRKTLSDETVSLLNF